MTFNNSFFSNSHTCWDLNFTPVGEEVVELCTISFRTEGRHDYLEIENGNLSLDWIKKTMLTRIN